MPPESMIVVTLVNSVTRVTGIAFGIAEARSQYKSRGCEVAMLPVLGVRARVMRSS
jgi:hypothetical protein